MGDRVEVNTKLIARTLVIAKHLVALLENPEPGLFTWTEMVCKRLDELQNLRGVDPSEVDEAKQNKDHG